MNVINYLIISYFCAVLFPVDLVIKRAILEVARRASSRLLSEELEEISERKKHYILFFSTLGYALSYFRY